MTSAETLRSKARHRATSNGHRLPPFKMLPVTAEWSSWTATCRDCGRLAAVNIARTREESIDGTAITDTCEGKRTWANAYRGFRADLSAQAREVRGL